MMYDISTWCNNNNNTNSTQHTKAYIHITSEVCKHPERSLVDTVACQPRAEHTHTYKISSDTYIHTHTYTHIHTYIYIHTHA